MPNHETEQGFSNNENESATLGQFLTQCRKNEGLSQSQAAKEIGISAGYLGKIEQDQTKNISLLIAFDIAQHYGVDIDILAEIHEHQEEKEVDKQIGELEREVEEVAEVKVRLDLDEVSLHSKKLYLKFLSSLIS